jgi:hypothetical protein
MQNNALQHIIKRFDEKMIHTLQYKRLYNQDNVNTLRFEEEDFDKLWDMCKDDSIGFHLCSSMNSLNKIKAYRKVVFFKGLPMWVVFTSVKKKPKTIYPVRKNLLDKIPKKDR